MIEDPRFTQDYHDQSKRSLANALLVTLRDGTQLPEVVIEYPQGHVRREETLELVKLKARRNLELKLSPKRVDNIMGRFNDATFNSLPVNHFIDMFVP